MTRCRVFTFPLFSRKCRASGKKCWKSLFYSKTKKSAILFLLFLLFASKIFGFKIGETCKTKSWRRDRSNWVRVLNLFQGPHSSVLFLSSCLFVDYHSLDASENWLWSSRCHSHISDAIELLLFNFSRRCSMSKFEDLDNEVHVPDLRRVREIDLYKSYMSITKFKDLVV